MPRNGSPNSGSLTNSLHSHEEAMASPWDMTEITWSTKPETFTTWTYTETACQLLVYGTLKSPLLKAHIKTCPLL